MKVIKTLKHTLFVAITYGKVSLWLWKSLQNSGIFSPTLWPPCATLRIDSLYILNRHARCRRCFEDKNVGKCYSRVVFARGDKGTCHDHLILRYHPLELNLVSLGRMRSMPLTGENLAKSRLV